MQQLRMLTAFLLLLLLFAAAADAHNITRILANHPDFSMFNQYLTTTHLADEINRRRTITVCAVDNAAMGELLGHHYPLPTIKNILSLHIFADYFGSKKLHQITHGSTTTSSLFQATGEATGTAGYVNITDMKGGKVGFSAVYGTMATYVKSLKELPYNISVIQISHVLTSPEAEAPAAAPSDLNLTLLMSRQGCKAFSDMMSAQGADETFAGSAAGGLTIFCPSDEALRSFRPRYDNLSDGNKTAVLLYHGVPVYNSMGMLRSSNGVMNTLATEGEKKKFEFTVQNDGDDVKIETKVVTATIIGTLIDDDPVAVFKIDKVLLPRELFKAPASAHAPKAAAKSSAADDADTPGPAGDDDDEAAADEESSTSNDGGGGVVGSGFGAMCVSLVVVGFWAAIF